MLLNYNNELIQIEIVRSKRTTLCLSIKEDGSVVVKAPLLLSDEKIREIIDKKADWLTAKRKEVLKRQSKKIKREYVTGATLPYMGKEYPIEMIYAKKSSVEFMLSKEAPSESKIIIKTSKTEREDIQKLLKKWYKKQTKEVVLERVAYYSNIMKVSVTSVDIKSRKKEWGSCDNHGNITFNWKLVMTRPEAIDYVVVHELCHRKHMDHSKQFWKAVEAVCPDYKEQKAWLNENASNLNIE